MTQTTSLSYRDAGVDIDAGDALVERIKPLAKKTLRDGVLGGIGGFGALFEVPKRYQEPVLVSGTDGVGTKLRLAFDLNRHDTVGQDLVAMSVNDILVLGAESLFFLDYFACGKLDVDTAASVVGGIAQGCELGDVVLGLASSGAHSNGYSLVRKIIERSNPDMNAQFDGERTLADVVMAPTRIYVKQVLALLEKVAVKGMAHITGGGLLENVPRVLPENTVAELQKAAWPRPKLFDWMQAEGNVAENEMHRVFNCGIGLVIVVAAADADAALAELKAQGEAVYRIGVIRARQGDEAQTVVV